MNRMIGFDRKLQLDWLDATVAQCQSDKDPDRVRRDLDRLLENEIVGDKARRNTLTVLMRIWVKVPVEHMGIRDEGLALATQVAPTERLWLHWGMSLLAYPFFRDVAATVGQLGRLQGDFSQAQVQRRMIEGWGQRTTLERAVQRIVRTYVEWQVVLDSGRRSGYNLAPAHQTDNGDLALWLMGCALRANEAEQVPLRDMERLPYAFPFELTTFVGDVRRSERFETTRQGLDLEMVAIAG
jgi:hypothetical protein